MAYMNHNRPRFRVQGRETRQWNDDRGDAAAKWLRECRPSSKPKPVVHLLPPDHFDNLSPTDPHAQLPGVDMSDPPWK